jgi:hypothetical protein
MLCANDANLASGLDCTRVGSTAWHEGVKHVSTTAQTADAAPPHHTPTKTPPPPMLCTSDADLASGLDCTQVGSITGWRA